MPLQDSFSAHYAELCDGDYDCVDRIVLNGYFRFAQSPGGFRLWWRAWMGSDDKLDNAHLMRIAGRFSRRVRAWAKSRHVPLIDCRSDDRKHELAESLMPTPDGGLSRKLPAWAWAATIFSTRWRRLESPAQASSRYAARS